MVKTSASVRLPFESSTPSIARTKLAAFLTCQGIGPAAIDSGLIVLSADDRQRRLARQP